MCHFRTAFFNNHEQDLTLPPLFSYKHENFRDFLPSYEALMKISGFTCSPMRPTNELNSPTMPLPRSPFQVIEEKCITEPHMELMRAPKTPRYTFLVQGRGRDGRFLPKGVMPSDIAKRTTRKICGWCGAGKTTQWRIGPTNGSADMSVLCNACGINYRRAVLKVESDLDLDKLALETRPLRLSIIKSLKRKQRLSFRFKNRKQTKKPSRANSQKPYWLRRILCEA